MSKKVGNTFAFPLGLCIATIIMTVLAFTLILDRTSSTRTWTKTAPLEAVTVQKGDTAEDIMRSLLPADRKETENLGYLLDNVSLRTGEEHGELIPGQVLHMPIPYGEWLQRKIWP